MLDPADTPTQVRVTRLTVLPKGEPLYSECATHVEIEDEAAGEYVTITQQGGATKLDKRVAFNAEEWPHVATAVETLLKECRDPGSAD